MSRLKSLFFSLTLLGIGYLSSFFYMECKLLEDFIWGIHNGIFYFFFVPLLYFMVHLIFGKPLFGKYKDAVIFSIFSLVRIMFDYLFYEKPILKDVVFTFFGTIILFIMIKFFYRDNGTTKTSTE